MTTTLTRSVTTSRPPRMGAGHRRRPSLGRVLAWVAMILVIVVTLFPFYWMIITSFKQNRDLYVGATNTAHNPFIFNAPPTLDHVRLLFMKTLFPTWLANSLSVGAAVVVFDILFSEPDRTSPEQTLKLLPPQDAVTVAPLIAGRLTHDEIFARSIAASTSRV